MMRGAHLLLLGIIATPVAAENTPPPSGDAELGAYLAAQCLGCHQTDGSDQGIPAITGWTPVDFTAALTAYQNKTRKHQVMNLISSRLNDEDIAALAAYFKDLE